MKTTHYGVHYLKTLSGLMLLKNLYIAISYLNDKPVVFQFLQPNLLHSLALSASSVGNYATAPPIQNASTTNKISKFLKANSEQQDLATIAVGKENIVN